MGSFPARAKILGSGQVFTVKISPNSLSRNRIGVIVAKRTAPKAVERNRLRRKIFDLFREETGKPSYVKTTEGRDLLVLIKPIKLDADKEEKLFKELNLVKQRLNK